MANKRFDEYFNVFADLSNNHTFSSTILSHLNLKRAATSCHCSCKQSKRTSINQLERVVWLRKAMVMYARVALVDNRFGWVAALGGHLKQQKCRIRFVFGRCARESFWIYQKVVWVSHKALDWKRYQFGALVHDESWQRRNSEKHVTATHEQGSTPAYL